MKQDQYFPHELNTRNSTEVMNLIEEHGMAGYGIYWFLLEYLRVQDNYRGDLKVLKPLARSMKVRLSKLLTVLQDYGLFICDDFSFYSPKLLELMKPFEERRAKIKAYKQKLKLDNLLEIKHTEETINILEGKGKGEGKVKGKEETSSAEEVKDADGAAVAETSSTIRLAWEEYVDELGREQQWKEIMAMRTGLKKEFFTLYPRIVACFKEHVRALGKERTILSSSDAKHYFCFFLTPGSTTFQRLMAQLKQPPKENPFRFEERDTVTGRRSYCGVPIPNDAPPRPNAQAVWNEKTKKWIF